MYVARILFPVKVLGPGNRVGIWFDGCKHYCKGCSNPELWDFQECYRTDDETIKKLICSIAEQHHIDGFTLTGGDPFLQPKALREMLPFLNTISTDTLCYTGYLYEELKKKNEDILDQIAVLIDGRYIEAENHHALLRGSDNQRILILRDEYQERYENYLQTASNEIQNFRTRDSIISVGIHASDYDTKLKIKAAEMGFVEK